MKLHIEISGGWNLEDFQTFFASVERLHYIFCITNTDNINLNTDLYDHFKQLKRDDYDGKLSDFLFRQILNFNRSENLDDFFSQLRHHNDIYKYSESIERMFQLFLQRELHPYNRIPDEALYSRYEYTNNLLEETEKYGRLYKPRLWKKVQYLLGERFPLRINEIRYASPGFADFTGIGEAIKSICDLLIIIIETVSQAKKNKLERKKIQLEIDRMLIENYLFIIDEFKKRNIPESIAAHLLGEANSSYKEISDLILVNKLTKVSVIKKSNEKEDRH